MTTTRCFAWLYGSKEDCEKEAHEFFEKIRAGFEGGIEFPYEKFQVYLLENKHALEYIVAIAVFRDNNIDESVEINDKVVAWYEKCGADKPQDRIGKTGFVIPYWKSNYDILDKFGVFEPANP
ncbi:MAG TPA: hypothetical protein VN446_03210 [Candidatus Acidoferrum sp.]|nr:hypothetical protein [Candidatus Acidoferrum sp.]